MRDVAKRANVALSTVSHVMNNRANVAPETRERVLEAARELGYGLSQNQIKSVGVVSKRQMAEDGYPEFNPVYSLVLHGIDMACQRAGIQLMYSTLETDLDSVPLSLPSMLLESSVDSLILVGPSFSDPLARTVRQPSHSIVLVDSYAPDQADYDSIVPPSTDGMFLGVSHLIERGHRHIGLIGTRPTSHPSIVRRREGYLLALADNGIADTYIEDGALGDEADIFACVQRLLERAPHITAIAAANDDTAVHVQRAAKALGRRVPHDLSLIGYDDSKFAQSMNPPLTTIRFDPVWLGRLAVETLLERAENPERPPVTIAPKAVLVERESVRAL
jgi:LacI family transcriptional regulator